MEFPIGTIPLLGTKTSKPSDRSEGGSASPKLCGPRVAESGDAFTEEEGMPEGQKIHGWIPKGSKTEKTFITP